MQRPPVTVIIFALTIAFTLSACATSTPPVQVLDSNECSQLVLSGNNVLVSLGSKDGIQTQSTEVYLRNPGVAPQGSGMNVEIALVNGSDVLSSRTQAIFGKPSGVEIAILPDLDADLLAAAPDSDSSDSNKIYYFADVIQTVLDQLSINDHGSAANVALVAIPGHPPRRFISSNAAFNFLMLSLPEMAAPEQDEMRSRAGDTLFEWLKTPGKLPRLMLVLRLGQTGADLREYGKLISESGSLAPPPLMVVDIGQGGNSQLDGDLIIVPLGFPPRNFRAPEWPAPDQWRHRLDGMRQTLADTLPIAISRISQVFEIPELAWPVLMTQEQFEKTVMRVKWHSAQGDLVCSRKLALLAPPSEQSMTPYSNWIGWSAAVTSLFSLVVFFSPQLRVVIRSKLSRST